VIGGVVSEEITADHLRVMCWSSWSEAPIAPINVHNQEISLYLLLPFCGRSFSASVGQKVNYSIDSMGGFISLAALKWVGKLCLKSSDCYLVDLVSRACR